MCGWRWRSVWAFLRRLSAPPVLRLRALFVKRLLDSTLKKESRAFLRILSTEGRDVRLCWAESKDLKPEAKAQAEDLVLRSSGYEPRFSGYEPELQAEDLVLRSPALAASSLTSLPQVQAHRPLVFKAHRPGGLVFKAHRLKYEPSSYLSL